MPATDPEVVRALALELRRHLAWQEENWLQRVPRDPALYAALARAALTENGEMPEESRSGGRSYRPGDEDPSRSEDRSHRPGDEDPSRSEERSHRSREAAAPQPVMARNEVATPRTLEAVRAELGDCRRCKLCQGRKQIVFGVGNPKAELVFVGEGPGADEDAQGIPFVGKAGQLLTKMIEAMGFTRDEVYICNVVKCRPPGNRNPEPDEIEACEPFLKAQLASLRPKAIVALGKFAAQTLLRDATSITRLRGHWREYEGIRLMPTFHPAYLLRTPAAKKEAWADLQQVMAVFGKGKRA